MFFAHLERLNPEQRRAVEHGKPGATPGGPATAKKMKRLGIETGLDLRAQTLAFLQHHFGKAGAYYYWAARGIDERPVRSDRIRKSIGAENTFATDLSTYEAARDALREIVDKVWGYCEGSGLRGRTVTLKVKFANFRQITRSRTGQTQIETRSELEQLGNALLEPLFPVARGIRLLGVSLSSIGTEKAERERQVSLSLYAVDRRRIVGGGFVTYPPMSGCPPVVRSSAVTA